MPQTLKSLPDAEPSTLCRRVAVSFNQWTRRDFLCGACVIAAGDSRPNVPRLGNNSHCVTRCEYTMEERQSIGEGNTINEPYTVLHLPGSTAYADGFQPCAMAPDHRWPSFSVAPSLGQHFPAHLSTHEALPPA